MRTKILGSGMSGLLGSRITELIKSEFEIVDLSRASINICDADQVRNFMSAQEGSHFLHFAAKTNVDGCELDKPLGTSGEAWKVNVAGTQNVVDAAQKYGKKVISISTDFVFDGTRDWYTERDQPNPINWYGVTKYEAEKITLKNPQNCVVRLAYPYLTKIITKRDFFHVFMETLQQKKTLSALTDHYFTPTFVDDIAAALAALIKTNTTGIVHVVGSTSLTPFAAAQEIAEKCGLDKTLIRPTTIAEFYKNRAQRPYKLQLKNDTISSLGITMRTFSEGLTEIKRQGGFI